MRRIKGGLVIIFDGIDGAGKSTQLSLAKEALANDGWQVYPTRNLGGSPIGEELRNALLKPVPRPGLTDFYVGVAIQEALIQVLNDQRELGSIILMDRGPMSLAVYQAYGSGIDKELAFKFADEGMDLIKPELCVVYDADVDIALERAKKRPGAEDYFQSKPDSFFINVKNGYIDCAARYKSATVPADGSAENVHQKTMDLINKILKGRPTF
jgi:dTMP kinase